MLEPIDDEMNLGAAYGAINQLLDEEDYTGKVSEDREWSRALLENEIHRPDAAFIIYSDGRSSISDNPGKDYKTLEDAFGNLDSRIALSSPLNGDTVQNCIYAVEPDTNEVVFSFIGLKEDDYYCS